MSLKLAELELGWPNREVLLNPKGPGPRAALELIKRKLAPTLEAEGIHGVSIGIISQDSRSDSFEPPIGIVAEFPFQASDLIVARTRDAAWNFSYAPLLVTAHPGGLAGWSCWEAPRHDETGRSQIDPIAHLDDATRSSKSARDARRSLNWSSIISRNFIQMKSARFQTKSRVDNSLLNNLEFVAARLRDDGLQSSGVLRLLTTVVLLSFLEQKRDKANATLLNSNLLSRVSERRDIQTSHPTLADTILDSHACIRLLLHVQETLGGDLVSSDDIDQYSGATHGQLSLLSDLVSGRLHVRSQQQNLWPMYRFDTIPVELVSSIYQARAANPRAGIQSTTPPHVAEFMIDCVMQENRLESPAMVIDPCCGSGVLLVKCFQRLVRNWRRDNAWSDPGVEILKGLQAQVWGTDIDDDALKVSAFSLHLAFLDEALPSCHWGDIRLPDLRANRLVHQDFFSFCSDPKHKNRFHVVVGNVPWGRKSAEQLESARRWAASSGWKPVNKSMDLLFVPAAFNIAHPEGSLALLVSADSLLFNRSTAHLSFRRRLFAECDVSEISVFQSRGHLQQGRPETVSIISGKPSAGEVNEHNIRYLVARDTVGLDAIIIDAHDAHQVSTSQAGEDPRIWSILLHGNARHADLIDGIQRRACSLDAALKGQNGVARVGLIRGDPNGKCGRTEVPEIVGRRILSLDSFPAGDPIEVRPSELPVNDDPSMQATDRPSNLDHFQTPQLILRRGWRQDLSRYHAISVQEEPGRPGAICMRAFISIHADDEDFLRKVRTLTNSQFASYYLRLTTAAGRVGEPLQSDFLGLPFSDRIVPVEGPTAHSEAVDRSVAAALGLKEADQILMEDFLALDRNSRDGLKRSQTPATRSDLERYCINFQTVLHAAFGATKPFHGTLIPPSLHDNQSMCAVSFSLGRTSGHPALPISSVTDILNFIETNGRMAWRGRVAFGLTVFSGEPELHVVKPASLRYWTRTAAMLDADMVTATLVSGSSED